MGRIFPALEIIGLGSGIARIWSVLLLFIYLLNPLPKKKITMDAFALIRENWSLMFIDL